MDNYLYDICRMTILCVDDDIQTLEMMRIVLSKNYPNQKLVFADNAFDALNISINIDPDIFVVDLYMPYIDGAKFSETISNWNVEKSIVMMSASSHQVLSKKCLELGIKNHITKPFDLVYLYEMLDNIMEIIFLKRLNAVKALKHPDHCKTH